MSAGFCRDCIGDLREGDRRCPSCGSPRVLGHPELGALTVAHIDCDAFYASIEKRDDPSLRDRPVIVGGGKRGVVAAACYVARTFGVRSAMPMFEARRLCPTAVVIPPNMQKYARIGREIRQRMLELTPLVEPLSIDEAFLDLSGTLGLHGVTPAKTLALFADRVEKALGITVSIGLAPNKFLAKIASDLDKPRGFAVLGAREAPAFLAPKPVTFIYGVGKATQANLAAQGFRIIADLQRADEADLMRYFGAEGLRLGRLARGIDTRKVEADHETKSVSAETTFDHDISELRALERQLWELAERVSARLKVQELGGATITLKLKTAGFNLRTRARSLAAPTQLAGRIFAAGRDLLMREADGTKFRLIGISVSNLVAAEHADPGDLIGDRAKKAERAVDRIRMRFGKTAVIKGLSIEMDD